jgi:hypothetical protein
MRRFQGYDLKDFRLREDQSCGCGVSGRRYVWTVQRILQSSLVPRCGCPMLTLFF